jgi:TonB-dependent receptor-like protein
MKKIILLASLSLFLVWTSAQTYIGKRALSPADKLNNEYCSSLFKTTDGTILNVGYDVSAKSYLNILDWLQGRVAGLQVYHQKDGTPIPFIRNSKALVYLDEVPVSAETLNSIPSVDIAMIKIIKGAFVGAPGNGNGGVIAVYTFKGDENIDESGDDGQP